MENKKSMTKGLKKLLIASIIFGALVLILFFVFPFLAKDTGEPEFASFPEFAKYLFANLANLLVFKYGNPDNFVYFGISIGVYVMLICWLIAVIAGVFVCDNRKTALLVISFPLGLFNCLIYALLASFSQTYWHVIAGAGGFNGKIVLLILVICTLVFYLVYFMMNIIFYFWAMARCFAFEKEEPKKEEPVPEPEPQPEPVEVVEEPKKEEKKEELKPVEYQPIRVIIVNKNKKLIKPVPQEEPKPEPTQEVEPEKEPVLEPIPEPVIEPVEVVEEPKKEEVVPLKEEAPKQGAHKEESEDDDDAEEGKNKREPFLMRIVNADDDIKANYNEIKNELLSYGLKARMARGGETFKRHDKRFAKIYLVGKTLKVYFALQPDDYKDSPIPVEDVGYRLNYMDLPLLFKVRSGLSVRRCKELVKAACEKGDLEQGEVGNVNWAKELEAENAKKQNDKKNK